MGVLSLIISIIGFIVVVVGTTSLWGSSTMLWVGFILSIVSFGIGLISILKESIKKYGLKAIFISGASIIVGIIKLFINRTLYLKDII